MNPFFKELIAISDTALSTVGNILNFNSTNQPAQTLQREESNRRNTPRPPQEEKHSTTLCPQKPQASADEEESSASTRSDIPPSSEGAKTTREKGRSYDAGPYRSGEASSNSAESKNYGTLRVERSLEEENVRTKKEKSYSSLSLDGPPEKIVIEKYRQKYLVPLETAHTEKAIEQRRKFVEKMNSQLARDGKKQGLQSPDRVYQGPGR